ncbi:MAG: aminotransferase class V-fold PLP-dependent enzyme, partial [Clostridia bacterium]|nr:aminotransferase class V-fold PLP-dependent enzyme [Clostridia bacterium]
AHQLSLQAAEVVYQCREALSALLGLDAPEGIVFTQNTTYALNMLLKGFLREGDHVLISELEHNAVRRPLGRLSEERGISYSTFPVVGLDTPALLAGIRARIQTNTVAIMTTHASNICSLTLPLREIGALCRQRGIRFFVDAAQSAGRLPIDMKAMAIDALAAPGHKSLLGIQGCGFLALSPELRLTTLIEGGSGMHSKLLSMPEEIPERLEAGTLPVPAIAGLAAGVAFLREMGLEEIERREKELFLATKERLSTLPDVVIHQPDAAGAVLLFHRRGQDATAVAAMLDRAGIAVRAGLHCAPLAHTALGTPPEGAVRVSFGPFNTLSDVDALWQALKA